MTKLPHLNENEDENRNQNRNLRDVKESVKRVGQESRVAVPSAEVPGLGHVKSLALKQLVCGIIAGTVASFAVSPFEVVHTRVVAEHGGRSVWEVLQRVAKFEGIESLLKGNLKVSLFATSLQKGVQFSVFEGVKRNVEAKIGGSKDWVPVSGVAGASAGLASTMVVYPFNTLMDRLLLEPNKYPSLWRAVSKVVRQNGVSELYRGFVPAILTLVPQAAVSFYTYETLSNRLKDSKKLHSPIAESVGSGTVAGLVATALTYPLELARKKISVSATPKGRVGTGGSYDNLSQALSGIVRREGVGGLYRGFVVQALQFVPLTSISFVVYEVAKRGLIAQGEEGRDEIKG